MQKIALITGGANRERDVSFVSAAAVEKGLNNLGYTDIQRIDYPHEVDILTALCKMGNIDFARVMIHGVGGEDGEVQRILDMYNIPYQTAPADIMALTMDKHLTKRMWEQVGLPLPKGLLIDSTEYDLQQLYGKIKEDIDYPCIAKDTREGSSFGINLLRSQDDLEDWRKIKDPTRQYLIEQFIAGKELTIGVRDTLEGGVEALPTILIENASNNALLDTDSKYNGAMIKHCPAPLATELLKKCEELAMAAYQAVGCQKYGRVDMMLGAQGPMLLEINTIPGFTPTSLFPKAAAVAGYSFEDVLERLMAL